MAFLHFKNIDELKDFESQMMKNFEADILEYSFDIVKTQTKLDWMPKTIIEKIRRNEKIISY